MKQPQPADATTAAPTVFLTRSGVSKLLGVSPNTITADVDYTPSEKWSVYGFYTSEKNEDDLRGRQSGGSVSSNPLDDWTSAVGNNDLKAWAFVFGGWFEDYNSEDAQTSGLVNYVPGSFFLAANDGSYQAWWAYLKLSYRW